MSKPNNVRRLRNAPRRSIYRVFYDILRHATKPIRINYLLLKARANYRQVQQAFVYGLLDRTGNTYLISEKGRQYTDAFRPLLQAEVCKQQLDKFLQPEEHS